MHTRENFLRALAVGLAVLAIGGCSEQAGGGDGSSDGDGPLGGAPAPVFPEGSGQPANGQLVYPAGPYGVSKGSTIANYQFIGFANSLVHSSVMVPIQLADFYNPTGAETFPEGSSYGAGTPKPKAMSLIVSAVWCGPCNYEADVILPPLYAKYKPMGGEFLLNLADGPTPGKAAETKHLYNWVTKYEVDYPSVVDPSYKLGALFESDAFPANMIIDLRTMKIIDVISGAPEEDGVYWAMFEEVIAGTYGQ